MRNSVHFTFTGGTTALAATPGDNLSRPDAATLTPDIRCLGPEDESELFRVLLSLDRSSRRSRFGQCVSDTYLAHHAQTALGNANWIAGAFIDERLRGVVEVYDCKSHGWAEAAFVVEQEWRRRGLGWTLLRAAMRKTADASETNTLRMTFSRHNWPMRKLAAKANGRFDVILDEISVDLAVNGQIG